MGILDKFAGDYPGDFKIYHKDASLYLILLLQKNEEPPHISVEFKLNNENYKKLNEFIIGKMIQSEFQQKKIDLFSYEFINNSSEYKFVLYGTNKRVQIFNR